VTKLSRIAGGAYSYSRIHQVIATLCILAFALLAAFPTQAQETEPWMLAVAGPMTGEDALLGQAMVDAAQLRVDQINATGGVAGRMVSLKVYDDQNSPEKAAEVAAEIARSDDVLTVLGHRTSGTSIAAGPVYAANSIPAISGTATADLVTAANPWYFRVTYNNSLQADFIANYINSVLGYRTATMIWSDSVYGSSLANAFVESASLLPLEITHQYSVNADSPDIDFDMADIVAELSLMPDSGMVFLAMSSANAAHFVREMRNSGFTLPVFGPDSINQQFPDNFAPDAVLKTRPGDFTDQIYATTSMIWDVANEDAVNFRDEFRERYGFIPDSGHALYYDAASVALEAIDAAGLTGTDIAADREAIREHLSSIDEPTEAFEGLTGKIYFDAIGNAIKTVPVGIFELGEFISAPVQLEPVINPVMVPNFADKLESGEIIAFADGYMTKTQIVYFGLDLNEVSNLNTAAGNYTLDFYVWLRYRGDLDISKVQFTNADEQIELVDPIWSRERAGMQIDTFKVRGTFRGDFEFQDYPFDKQRIVLEVRHRDLTSESLRFVTDNLGMRLAGDDITLLQRVSEDGAFASSKGWIVTGAQIFQDLVKTASTLGETRSFQGETAVNFSRMKLELEISRQLTSYSTTIMLPMFILFIIGWLFFAVPIKELPPRLSGGILVLVTVGLLRARLSNDLPNIGYLVAIDYIFFALQIIMWFSIAVSVLSFWVQERVSVRAASRVNLVGAILYPIPVFAVGIYILLTLSPTA